MYSLILKKAVPLIFLPYNEENCPLISIGGQLYVCPLYQPAFDTVSNWKLFDVLLTRGVSRSIVRVLCSMYCKSSKTRFCT